MAITISAEYEYGSFFLSFKCEVLSLLVVHTILSGGGRLGEHLFKIHVPMDASVVLPKVRPLQVNFLFPILDRLAGNTWVNQLSDTQGHVQEFGVDWSGGVNYDTTNWAYKAAGTGQAKTRPLISAINRVIVVFSSRRMVKIVRQYTKSCRPYVEC